MKTEEKLSEQIYNSIRDDIITGAIDDQTFLTEKELAKRYEVSKAPVRDALHLLCAQRYLISYPRKGYMVARYSQKDVQQMQMVRLPLERLAVELVIANASNEEIAGLRAFNIRQQGTTDPSMTSNAMHLAQLSGNPYLAQALQPLVNNVARFWIQIDVSMDFSKHNDLIDAMLHRDLPLALQILEEDLADA